MPEFTVESLLAYLRQYGGRYNLAELSRYMAEQGASPERIEEAVALYQAEGGAGRSKPSGPAILFGCLGGFALAVISVVLVIAGLLLLGTRDQSLPSWFLLTFGTGTGLFALWVAIRPFLRKK